MHGNGRLCNGETWGGLNSHLTSKKLYLHKLIFGLCHNISAVNSISKSALNKCLKMHKIGY